MSRMVSDPIVCSDAGGIPEACIERIFDLYFTTREYKGGSGLGLHIVFNIVNNLLGGKITVKSKAGEFTIIRLELPVSVPNADVWLVQR